MKKKAQKFRLKIPSITENLYLIRDFIIKIAAKTGFNEEEQEQMRKDIDGEISSG